MKTIYRNASDSESFQRIRKTANHGVFDGRHITPYFEECRWWLERFDCLIIFTRDVGHHTSGWWKNPDYERCYHLSISFPGGRNRKKEEYVLQKLFRSNCRLLWCEPPYSIEGKKAEVYHYRLFCDENWEAIKPRGEVYNTQFTELGWKSFSEIHRR